MTRPATAILRRRDPATEELPAASGDGAGPGRRRRRAVPLALGLGALAVTAVVVLTVLGGDGGNGGRRAAAGGSTVAVTRQTLVQRETVDGTLGFAGNRTVINRLGGSGSADPSSGADSGADSQDASSGTPTSATVPTMAVATIASDAPEEPDDEPAGDEQRESGQPEGEQPQGQRPQDGDPDTQRPKGGHPEGGQPQDGQPNARPQTGEPGAQRPAAGSQAPAGGDPGSGSGDDGSGSGSGDGYSGSGTVTALPRPGSIVERGEPLYRLDGEPIVLMYGSTPAYRDLEAGVDDGRDVRQLEQNLAALGFDPGTVDDTFSSSTATAVADWQESVGLAETGSVELGRVVFLPGARRIGEHKTSVGDVLGAGSEVLDTSSTKRLVNVELDASLQSLARKGDGVEVTLPDGSTVKGRISEVGRVAREKESSDASTPDAGGGEPELVIDVSVELRSARGIGRLDEAPVGVGLAQETRKNVLAVPVDALVARRGGGYGVELASTHRIVPVRTGLFASGYVEISGDGVRDGTRVVVPDE